MLKLALLPLTVLMASSAAPAPARVTGEGFQRVELADGRVIEAIALADSSSGPLLAWYAPGGELSVVPEGDVAIKAVTPREPVAAPPAVAGSLKVTWRKGNVGWRLGEPGLVQKVTLSDARGGDLAIRYVMVPELEATPVAVAWTITRDGRVADEGRLVFSARGKAAESVRAREKADAFTLQIAFDPAR